MNRRSKAAIQRDDDLFLSLPPEILFDILSRVPVKPLLKCKSLSKNWFQLVTSPGFIRLHMEHAKLSPQKILFASSKSGVTYLHSISEYETPNTAAASMVTYPFQLPGKMVGTCNGLVCLSDYKTTIVVCNPTSPKEHISMLFEKSDVLPNDYKEEFCLGFGHDPVSDEYKVMRVDFSYRKGTGADADDDSLYSENTNVYVYTLGSKSWRKIESPRFPLDRGIPSLPYVSGALHLFERSPECKLKDNPQIVRSIVAFDVRSEKFTGMSMPDTKAGGLNTGVLHGCLSLSAFRREERYFDIWLMKKHGVIESWTKVYSILLKDIPQNDLVPFLVREDKVVLLAPWSRSIRKTEIYAYDPTSSKVDVHTPAIIGLINVEAYVETLVQIPRKQQNTSKGRKRTVYTYFS